MKLKYFSLTVFLSAFALLLCSNKTGYTHNNFVSRTGSTSATVGCGGSGCHSTGATAGIRISVELDSVGVPVTSYQPGGSYTVKMSATNTTSNILSVFGFGLSAVKAAGAGTASAHQAGTWSPTLPPGIQNSVESTALTVVIEQQGPLPATSGSGASGTTYVQNIGWTAPAAGTGAVKLFAVINAANGDGTNGPEDKWNNTSTTINEAGTTAISEIAPDLGAVNAYPTLMGNTLTTAFDLRREASVTIDLLSLTGQVVRTLLPEEAVGTGAQVRSFGVGDLPTGVYLVRVQADGHTTIAKVVKQ